jgi:hypothetical protein
VDLIIKFIECKRKKAQERQILVQKLLSSLDDITDTTEKPDDPIVKTDG